VATDRLSLKSVLDVKLRRPSQRAWNQILSKIEETSREIALSCRVRAGHVGIANIVPSYRYDLRVHHAGPFDEPPLVVTTRELNHCDVQAPRDVGAEPDPRHWSYSRIHKCTRGT
jgi:hypothetical protein